MGYLSSLIITLNNGESTMTYTAEYPGQPLSGTFDQGYGHVKNSAGETWLEINYESFVNSEVTLRYSSIFIHDYFSRTTIGVFQIVTASSVPNGFAEAFNYYSFSVRYFNQYLKT